MVLDKKQWKREFSAGGVVYKKDNGRIFILLIMPKGPNFGPPTGIWSFPKGHIDQGEKIEDAALREVKEEGGVEAKIIERLGTIKYPFQLKDLNIFKIVTYFLMEYVGGEVRHDEEIADARWFEFTEAEQLMHFPGDKSTFNHAKEILIT